MAVALRTEVFLVGAFSSAGTAGETGVSLAGLVFAVAFGAVLTSAAFGAGSAFTAGLSSALASALGAAALVVVFLAVVVARLRVVVLAAGFASTAALALGSEGASSTLTTDFAAAFAVVFGLVIVAVSCHQGFATREGAVGVGRATRRTVIVSFLLILMLGFVVTRLCYR